MDEVSEQLTPADAGTLWHTDRAECVRIFQKGIEDGDLDAYAEGLTHLEWDARIKQGLMPYHSANMRDMFFDFEFKNLVNFQQILTEKHAQYPSNPGFAMLLGFVLDALGANSQYFYNIAAAKAGGLADMIQYEWLEPSPDTKNLCGLVNVRECERDTDNILMVSVDSVYAQKFLRGFVDSYLANTDQGLIVHLMDCPYALVDEVRQRPGFGIVAEWPNGNRNYYHAFRFIRMAHLMSHYKRKIWASDVDVRINDDMAEIFDLPGDLVWRARPARLEPWNQINACLYGCSDQGYADHVAGYIGRLAKEDKLCWGSDQMAMWATYKQLAPQGLSVSCLDDRQLCYDDRPDAIVTAYSGARKALLPS